MFKLSNKQWKHVSLQEVKKFVSTWSPLATAFNSPPYKKLNFSCNEQGLFLIPELQCPEGFNLLQNNAINKTKHLITEATSTDRKRKMVEIFDELSDSLCKVADLAEFIRIAHPHNDYTLAAERACISISRVVESLNTHKQLYSALRSVVKFGDIMPTTVLDTRVAELFLFDFEQSGIHLSEKDRQKVVQLNDHILQIGQRFMNGSILPTVIEKERVSEQIRNYFPAEGENILASGLFTNSPDAQAREAAYRLYLHPSESQEKFLSDLLVSRYELARICGFDTYAHRALKASTVEHPQMVYEFIDELTTSLRERADKDFKLMERVKRKESSNKNTKVAAWDTPYYTSRIKQNVLNASANEFLPYFSLGGCMEGIDNLMKSLYGIHFDTTKLEPGEVWSNDIYKLAVIHETEGLLGYIYCDFFERLGKPNQDCHFTIQGGKELSDGSYQIPIVVVMLNLSQPGWSGPTLLTPSRVDNLFHEMGHAMHSMLARTKYQHVTGTRCSTDFAEVPSVLMEYFANDSRVLRTFAKHYVNGTRIPDDLLYRLCASRNLFSASETQIQVFYTALDQIYHGDVSKHQGDTTATLKEVQKKYYSLPHVENTAWQLRFSHLVGYGAKYYSYLISKTIASWIWQTYFEKNPFNRTAGEKYRKEMLAHGGSFPSRLLVSNFLNVNITPQNLTQSLINEIDLNNDKVKTITENITHI